MAVLYFDGSVKDGKASCGFVLEAGLDIKETHVLPDSVTSHEAEYHGLILGLEKAIALGVSDLDIVGDAREVIRKVTGEVKTRRLFRLNERVKSLLTLMPRYTFRWVTRDDNKADLYSRL